MSRPGLLAVAVLVAATACGTTEGVRSSARPTSTAEPSAGPQSTAPAAVAPETTTTVATRSVTATAWSPFATAGPLTLTHPANRVERVAFHQSNHDGARQLTALPAAVAPATLGNRERDTGGTGAADVVVEPGTEIRAPVTGTVKRAGRYILYCRHSDDYVVIAPDVQPAWEVKVLHIDGVAVRTGDRVVAGQTVIAPRATHLPFESQVDELRTAEPAWPHVHIEVVDPRVPDRPTGPGCP
jgi:biotin carboxyl carrier protein